MELTNARAVGGSLPPNPNLDSIVESVAREHVVVSEPNVWYSKDRPGLAFRMLKMARMILADAGERIPMPEAPVVWIPEKERNEPNPHDPAYLLALRAANYQRSVVYINTTLALGTQLHNAPSDVCPLLDEDWVERVEISGLKVPEGKYARYVCWIRWYLLSEDELTDLVRAVQRYNGTVLEEDVTEAVDRFPDNETRSTDTRTLSEEES